MLWSLFKIVLFVAIVALLAIGVGYLLEMGDAIRIVVAGTEFTLRPLPALIVGIVLIVAAWLFVKLLGLLGAVVRFLIGDETAISRYFNRSRERRGYRALAAGVQALAEGDATAALRAADKAETNLRRPELTRMLTAQAAEMAGDGARAERAYRAMLAEPATRFAGVRGLMRQKLAEGDTAKARKLAEQALALKPRHAETQDTLLGLQARAGDWEGARRTLATQARTRGLPRDVHNRRDATLAIAAAQDAARADKLDQATATKVLAANRKSPDLVPGAVLAARAKTEQGARKAADRIIKRAWESGAHPELAAAFAAIVPNESPAERRRRFEPLIARFPDDPEARMLAAELALADEDFPGARRAMRNLAETHPTQRALTLMAAIEKGEGAPEAVVRGWLAKAVTAPRGRQWVCENCGHADICWAPACPSCGSFDTFTWKNPPAAAAEAGAENMLPLIVGPAEPQDAPDASQPRAEPVT
jgi:HemY protein